MDDNINNFDELSYLVVTLHKRPKIPENNFNSIEIYLINVMKECWQHDLNKRPTIDFLLESLRKN